MSPIWSRTSAAFDSLARSTGTRTPSSRVVITIVTIAAMLGAALRRSARKASERKKKTRPIGPCLVLEPEGSASEWPLVSPSSPTPISARTRAANSFVDSSSW